MPDPAPANSPGGGPPPDPEVCPYVTPNDLRLLWFPAAGWEAVVYWSARDGGARRAAYYRLTPAVWAWVWQRAVKLEEMVVVGGREEYRNQYRQLCERIAPLLAWVGEQERAGREGWAGGKWREILRPKLPEKPWCPEWVASQEEDRARAAAWMESRFGGQLDCDRSETP